MFALDAWIEIVQSFSKVHPYLLRGHFGGGNAKTGTCVVARHPTSTRNPRAYIPWDGRAHRPHEGSLSVKCFPLHFEEFSKVTKRIVVMAIRLHST